jgi:hypothetical protein
MMSSKHPSPLDEEQEFADASSYQVRDELAGLIERDLLARRYVRLGRGFVADVSRSDPASLSAAVRPGLR